MTTQTDIPLSKLKLSPTNARHDPGDVTTLANSIRSVGLISALAVTKNGRGWLVEAGGRRLAALQLLAEEGHIGAGHLVPCMVFDTPSLARSLAENHERAPMDAVQQFEAFARLIGEGRTVHDVAEAFSVTAQYVRQRVKLAELAPEWLKGYGKAKTLQALASIGLGELYMAEFKTLKAGEVYTKGAPLLAEKRWVPEYGTAGALRGGS